MHKELFDRLIQVVATLRGENGCPWDKAQTHETLKSDLIEETYEVIEAIDAKSSDKLQEELGDLLLLNVMLHAQIAKDQGDFSINEVVQFYNGQTHPPTPTRLWECRCGGHGDSASELGGNKAK